MRQLLLSGTVFGRFLQIVPVCCLAGVVYALCRFNYLKRKKKRLFEPKELIRLIFVCYIAGLVNLVLVPANMWTYVWFYIFNGHSGIENLRLLSGSYNLTPTIVKCLMGEFVLGGWVREMLAGNFLLFIPFGFFMPFVLNESAHNKILLFAFSIPALIEIIQPILGRSFDVDDVICGFLGFAAGSAAAETVLRISRRIRSNN